MRNVRMVFSGRNMRGAVKHLLVGSIVPAILIVYPRLVSSQDSGNRIDWHNMVEFSSALGVDCGYCHNGFNPPAQMLQGGSHNSCHHAEKFTADTPRKRTAKKMWNEYVAGNMVKVDGSRFECKDCHQGKAKFLPAIDGSTKPKEGSAVLVKRMKSYKEALGVRCVYCHDTSNFAKVTPKKVVAHQMIGFTREYELQDEKGNVSILTCSYCHNGKVKFLPAN